MAAIPRKLLSALLASIAFACILGLLSVGMRGAYDFHMYVLIYAIYGTPGLLLIGIPVSFLLDYGLGKIHTANAGVRTALTTVGYAIAGFAGGTIYLIVITSGRALQSSFGEWLPLSLLGILAALLFACIDRRLLASSKTIKPPVG